MRETGGDAGGEEGSIAADEAFAARRFAFCRAFQVLRLPLVLLRLVAARSVRDVARRV